MLNWILFVSSLCNNYDSSGILADISKGHLTNTGSSKSFVFSLLLSFILFSMTYRRPSRKKLSGAAGNYLYCSSISFCFSVVNTARSSSVRVVVSDSFFFRILALLILTWIDIPKVEVFQCGHSIEPLQAQHNTTEKEKVKWFF